MIEERCPTYLMHGSLCISTPASNETEFLANVAILVGARREGRLDRVVVWTLDDHMQLSLLLYHGVDGIMTNDPARLAVEYRRAL